MILSLDGVGAYDHIRRSAMLDKLRTTPALATLLPFTKLFYGSPSTYLWTDAAGTTHQVRQGEGGEQGDPLMPALYALGQHDGLERAKQQLHEDDFVVAFLDDLYVKTTRERAKAAFDAVAAAVEAHAGVKTNLGKLRAWSRAGGPPPPGFDEPPYADAWTADRPAAENGLRILGTPVGTPEFAAAHARERLEEERRLLAHLPELPDLQCAWLLLYFSAAARANHLLRVVPPLEIARYAEAHDDAMWDTLCHLLGLSREEHHEVARELSTLPLRLGGLGLRDARRTSPAAYWAGVADALPVLRSRLPDLADRALAELERAGGARGSGLRAAQEAAALLDREGYADRPEWRALAEGARPPPPEDTAPGE